MDNPVPQPSASDKDKFLKKLQLTPEEIIALERSTRVPYDATHEGFQQGSLRLTASRFGKVCKMTPTDRSNYSVSNVKKNTFKGNKYTDHGNKMEPKAREKFSETYKMKVEICGLFIDEEHGFLGAIPDGFIEKENCIVEIKCPYSVKDMDLKEAIKNGVIKFATLDEGEMKLDVTHDYYYQIQGQLRIANKETCYFVVYSPYSLQNSESVEEKQNGQMLVQEIGRDREFWENNMFDQLETFYMDHMLPTLLAQT